MLPQAAAAMLVWRSSLSLSPAAAAEVGLSALLFAIVGLGARAYDLSNLWRHDTAG
jgi:hypothetical protein